MKKSKERSKKLRSFFVQKNPLPRMIADMGGDKKIRYHE
jgi:hypothetical protein